MIRMRNAYVNGIGEVKVSAMAVKVGDMYQTLRDEWMIVTEDFGSVIIDGENMFAYRTRQATAEEIAVWNAPQVSESDFFDDFFSRTDYIGS